jgi:hypothetical protein
MMLGTRDGRPRPPSNVRVAVWMGDRKATCFPWMVREERDERRYAFKSAGPGWQRPLGTQATRVLGAVNPGRSHTDWSGP